MPPSDTYSSGIPPIRPYGQARNVARFDPFNAHQYSVDELIHFMQAERLTLKEINEVRNVALMGMDDFMKMLDAGVCRVEDLRECGVSPRELQNIEEAAMIRQVEEDAWNKVRNSGDIRVLELFLTDFPGGRFEPQATRRIETLTEERDWKDALSRNSLGAYAVYMEDHPEGQHIEEAKKRIHKLEHEEEEITEDLLADMRLHPWNYPAHTMEQLLNGSDFSIEGAAGRDDDGLPPAERFLARGFRLRFEALVDNGIIPPDFTKEEITSPDFVMPQTTDFDGFPLNRTDVYFIGVPRSGKSTVLGGLFSTMYREGHWEHVPILNSNGQDPSNDYYWGLISAIESRKSPESTAQDTISYISMNVPVTDQRGRPGTAKLNFVELSGEAVESLAQSISTTASTTKVWDQLGASAILRNNNSKMLFFLLDYNTIAGNRGSRQLLSQERTLKTALQVLTHDGTGNDHSRGCTMSKVESVAVLLTKADLMGTDDEDERQQKAMEYLHTNFSSFMNQLKSCCQTFNINSTSGYTPLVFTFSVGKYYVGNTLAFDSRDSLVLAQRIAQMAPYNTGRRLF